MGLYTKIDMYGFADFYHRFSTIGLTIEEIFLNWDKYKNKPRDLKDEIRLPKKMRSEVIKIRPDRRELIRLLHDACKTNNVSVMAVGSKNRKREIVEVRQWVAYIGCNLGYEPKDFKRILDWDRSGIYHKRDKAKELSENDTAYRNSLNEILQRFGLQPIIA